MHRCDQLAVSDNQESRSLDLQLVPFRREGSEPSIRFPIERTRIRKTQLQGHAPARVIVAPGPQREASCVELTLSPIDYSCARFGGQPAAGMV